MQIRRPLCLFSLIFVLVLTGCIYGGGRREESLPAEGEQITLTGTVKNKEYRVMYGEKVSVLYVGTVKDKNDRQVMCYIKNTGEGDMLPRMGETVKVSGKVSLFREASNPGEFNLREYYQILNVSYKLNQTEILERSESCFPFKETLYQIKCSCCEALDNIYPEKEASILKAMLLGEKNGLEEEIKELYQLNGLIHILAISGLHISLLGAAVSGILKKCGAPLWLRAPAAIALMWCYGTMTGMGVSTRRAVFMFSMHLAAELLGRTYDMLTAMSLAAVLMLAGQPLLVWHSGFLLSFGAVLGIGLVLPWWKEILGRLAGIGGTDREKVMRPQREKGMTAVQSKLRKKLTETVMEGLFLSSAITITTLPILLYFYYKYPFYSLFLNLYVIPLMGVLFAVGACSLAVGFVLPRAGLFLGIPDRFILWLYEVSCREVIKLPGAVKIAGRPEVWQIAVYYGVLFSLIFEQNLADERKNREDIGAGKSPERAEKPAKRELYIKKSTAGEIPAICQWMAVAGAVWLLLIRPFGGFSVSFVDVGQGDCIVMRNDNGNCYMVDGGSTSKSLVGKYQILPFLESMGIGELQAVFLTHPDEDHISGVLELMEQSGYGVKINTLILPDTSQKMKEEELGKLRRQAAKNGIAVCYIGRGDSIQDRNLKFSCVGPEKGIVTDEVNEISTVLHMEYGAFSMLLTGDVTGEPERELLAELEERGALTVLKVAHHGSRYSTPGEFLEMTDPVYAVISAGKDNRYGHPHEELMNRLKEQGCRIYQTPENGAITMKVRNGKIRVEKFLK